MIEDLESVLRQAMHNYADKHGLRADTFDMSPEVRGRANIVRWEIVGRQLRYEFLEPNVFRTRFLNQPVVGYTLTDVGECDVL